MRRFAASPRRFDDIHSHTWTVFESCSARWKNFFKRARFSCIYLRWNGWRCSKSNVFITFARLLCVSLTLYLCSSSISWYTSHTRPSAVSAIFLGHTHPYEFSLPPSLHRLFIFEKYSMVFQNSSSFSMARIWLTCCTLLLALILRYTFSSTVWDTR